MKAIKTFCALIIAVFFMSGNITTAQTKQVDLHATVNDYIFCLEKVLKGDYTYHFTYHIDKKTGVITNIHWNVKHCNLKDSDGNRYVIIDTGSDNLGSNWTMFNGLNAMNDELGANIQYDVEDGFMDLPDEGEWPTSGGFTWTFKVIGNGEVVTIKQLVRGYFDESGELILTADRWRDRCNW